MTVASGNMTQNSQINEDGKGTKLFNFTQTFHYVRYLTPAGPKPAADPELDPDPQHFSVDSRFEEKPGEGQVEDAEGGGAEAEGGPAPTAEEDNHAHAGLAPREQGESQSGAQLLLRVHLEPPARLPLQTPAR